MGELLLMYESHSLISYVIVCAALLFLMAVIWKKILKPSPLVMRRLYLIVIFLPILTYPLFYIHSRSCAFVSSGGQLQFPYLVCRLTELGSGWIIPFSLVLFFSTLVLSLKTYIKRRNFIYRAKNASLELEEGKISYVEELTQKIGVKSSPMIYVIPANDMISFTVGVFNPEIYLSKELVEVLDEKELKGVIAHELSHLKLKDTLWDIAVTVVSYLLVFSPFSLLGKEMYKKDREEACDILASFSTREPLSLGHGLLKVRKYQKEKNNIPMPVSFSFNKGTISSRVENLLWIESKGYHKNYYGKDSFIMRDRAKELLFLALAVTILIYIC